MDPDNVERRMTCSAVRKDCAELFVGHTESGDDISLDVDEDEEDDSGIYDESLVSFVY